MRIAHPSLHVLFAILALLSFAMHTAADESTNLNSPLSLQLKDLDGETVTPHGIPDHGALVLIFVTTDCPIANSYQPTIARLASDFQDRGVIIAVVHEGPDQSRDKLDKHAADYSVQCKLVSDPDHSIAHRLGVSITPEVCVLNNQGETLYQGSIDDLYPGFGKKRPKPTREHLKLALEEITSGARVSEPKTRAVGCSIPKPK
jgi:peroxiredoxin